MTFFYESPNSDIKIINDDFLKTKLIKEETIGLTITSPIYNVGINYNGYKDNLPLENYLEKVEKWLAKIFELTKSTGRLCLNVPFSVNVYDHVVILSYEYARLARKVGWEPKGEIIWNKGGTNSTAFGSWNSPSSPNIINSSESILVFYKDDWKKATRGTSNLSSEEFLENVKNVWSFNGVQQNKGHPATFPLDLPERCIKQFSFKEDIILDPFLGSGTTLLACSLNDRKAIGVEIDPHYCDLATRRIKAEIDQTRVDDFLEGLI